MVLSTAGCDGTAPGTSESATGSANATVAPTESVSVVVILPTQGSEVEPWVAAAHLEGFREKVIVDVKRASEVPKPGWQAEAIRDAITTAASAIVIVPDDPASLREVASEAKAAGIPIVCIHETIDGSSDAPLVEFASLDDAAAAIVKAAKDDAIAAGYPEAGETVILHDIGVEINKLPRKAALEKAATAAGLKIVAVAPFKGYAEAARDVLRPILKQHPDIAVVLADEDMGYTGATTVRDDFDVASKRFALSGFATSKENVGLAEMGANSAAAYLDMTAIIASAIRLAVDLAVGDEVKQPRVELPIPVTRATKAMMTPSPASRYRRAIPKLGQPEPN